MRPRAPLFQVLSTAAHAAAGAWSGPRMFKRLSTREVESYLASAEWREKAGGYAIQGIAGAFVVKLVGSYSAVVGLPLNETVGLLAGEGYPVHFNWLNAATLSPV